MDNKVIEDSSLSIFLLLNLNLLTFFGILWKNVFFLSLNLDMQIVILV